MLPCCHVTVTSGKIYTIIVLVQVSNYKVLSYNISLACMGNKKNKRNHYNTHRRSFKKKSHQYKSQPTTRSPKRVRSQPATQSPDRVPSQPATQSQQTVESIEGSRIINIDNLQHYIGRLTSHASHCGGNVKLIGEQRNGLASILNSSCSKCGDCIQFETSPKVKGPSGYKRWESNLAAVWGQMTIGGGYTHLKDTMSVLGIPAISKTSFIRTERDIGDLWEREMEKAMLDAGKEEKRLAEERGDLHHGVPAITVIVDGGWSKRSHKHSYNAKSGVGIIIGEKTSKILHSGVRNKYCSACTQGISPEKHRCFKKLE